MQDGHTRKLERTEVEQSLFLARHKAFLVVLEGPAAGSEYPLESASQTLGRGPGVDIVLPDDSMSREHAAVELGSEGFRVRDLGSTNGLTVNGRAVAGAELQNGDRLGLGEYTLQYVLEKHDRVGMFEL